MPFEVSLKYLRHDDRRLMKKVQLFKPWLNQILFLSTHLTDANWLQDTTRFKIFIAYDMKLELNDTFKKILQ